MSKPPHLGQTRNLAPHPSHILNVPFSTNRNVLFIHSSVTWRKSVPLHTAHFFSAAIKITTILGENYCPIFKHNLPYFKILFKCETPKVRCKGIDKINWRKKGVKAFRSGIIYFHSGLYGSGENSHPLRISST